MSAKNFGYALVHEAAIAIVDTIFTDLQFGLAGNRRPDEQPSAAQGRELAAGLDADRLQAAATLYAKNCAACHGQLGDDLWAFVYRPEAPAVRQ